MKANRAYSMKVTRGAGGRRPAFAAGDRQDHIEVVEIDTGEVVLFWDLDARRASRLARQLRRDLAQLEAAQFISAWQDA